MIYQNTIRKLLLYVNNYFIKLNEIRFLDNEIKSIQEIFDNIDKIL